MAHRTRLACSTLVGVLLGCGGDLTLPPDGLGPAGPPSGEPPSSGATLSAADDRFETREDANQVLTQPGVLANDAAEGASGSLTAQRLSGPEHGQLELDADGALRYSPDPDYFGDDQFTYRVTLGDQTSDPATVVIDVLPVNDPPAFTPGPDQRVGRKSGEHVVPGWATGIRPGPANESDQSVEFVIDITAGAEALKGRPSITPDGTLRFESSPKGGTAEVEVRLRDNGGTDNGGSDTSRSHTLRIQVDG